MTYEGWSNWETWNVNLWLSNDYGSYKHWTAAARFALIGNDKQEATEELADRMRKEPSPATPRTRVYDDEPATVYTDFITHSGDWSAVGWAEIAESWIITELEG